MRRQHFLIVAAALGAWVGYANPWAQFPLAVLALPAGLAALGLDAESPWIAFKRAWVAGTLAALGCLTCPPKPGPGIMLEFLTKEDGIWPGKDEHQNRL